MPDSKRILVLAPTATDAIPLRVAADKLALDTVLGCSDDTGALRLDFSTRDSALHIVEFVQENPVAAIIPIGDEPTPSAARAMSMIGLPFHPPKAADACVHPPLARLGGEATALAFECLMTSGKLRVLATQQHDSPPILFAALAPEVQDSAVEKLKSLVTKLSLRHGPVRVEFASNSGRLSPIRVSLCYEQTPFTDALRFRIPLVDQEISYAEVVIRNALDLDTSRVHLNTD